MIRFGPGFSVPGQPASIVVADSCLVILQDVLHTDISLDSLFGRGNILKHS